eukprot:gnl/TRDRNA2_/TRDRNA2_145891_c4_seq1.p1 gnl/TRDRNA2_/TRDRNA2_145891_c4~~gnl/TRDRNA2_/TRDRNA2_145891_c4_seq1.p1  ORF type:complete len:332 (+),score=52.72 gnl/TRDRNA2_/TRDRNA2_145891_c4_seq1:38-997(+)
MLPGQTCALTCAKESNLVGYFTCSAGQMLGESMCIQSEDPIRTEQVQKIAATLFVGIPSKNRRLQLGDEGQWIKDLLKEAIASAILVEEKEFTGFQINLKSAQDCEHPGREIPYEAVVPARLTEERVQNAIQLPLKGSPANLRFFTALQRAIPELDSSSVCVNNVVEPVTFKDEIARAPDGAVITTDDERVTQPIAVMARVAPPGEATDESGDDTSPILIGVLIAMAASGSSGLIYWKWMEQKKKAEEELKKQQEDLKRQSRMAAAARREEEERRQAEEYARAEEEARRFASEREKSKTPPVRCSPWPWSPGAWCSVVP